jgi:hypothetical protein
MFVSFFIDWKRVSHNFKEKFEGMVNEEEEKERTCNDQEGFFGTIVY